MQSTTTTPKLTRCISWLDEFFLDAENRKKKFFFGCVVQKIMQDAMSWYSLLCFYPVVTQILLKWSMWKMQFFTFWDPKIIRRVRKFIWDIKIYKYILHFKQSCTSFIKIYLCSNGEGFKYSNKFQYSLARWPQFCFTFSNFFYQIAIF